MTKLKEVQFVEDMKRSFYNILNFVFLKMPSKLGLIVTSI